MNIQHFIDYVHVHYFSRDFWQKENPRHELRGGVLGGGCLDQQRVEESNLDDQAAAAVAGAGVASLA